MAQPSTDQRGQLPTILERAYVFRDRGWRPFPCEYGGKRPAVGIKWGTATATEPSDGMLDRWFGRDPVNIAVAAKGSNLVILDEDELGALERLCKDHEQPLPVTYRVRTAKGWHWYFRAPDTVEIGNRAGVLADYGIDVRGGRGDGGYVVAAGSLHASGHVYVAEDDDADEVDLPWWLIELLLGDREPENDNPRIKDASPAKGERRFTMAEAEQYVREQAIEPLRSARTGTRNHALNAAALVVGHFVPAFWTFEAASKRLRALGEEIGLERDEVRGTVRSGLTGGMRDPYGRVEEAEGDEEEYDSWMPVDLVAYLDGTVKAPETSVGARRADGEQFLYAGLEHAAIGEMEAGKGWWALNHCAAELRAGNRVIYVHFEENSPAETVQRLHRNFGVDRQRILDDFRFVGPERQVGTDSIAALVADRAPTLVILDGQNEAMALHAQKINDPDGAADFRRRIVKPFTRVGATVLSLDHVVKDKEKNREGYALGSVHKGNGLNGAMFLLENCEPFGKERNGATQVYVTKDRPGELRKLGRLTDTPRKTFVGMMHVEAADVWRFRWEAPVSQDDGEDSEFAEMRETRRRSEYDAKVLAAIAEMNGRQLYPSKSLAHGAVGGRKADVIAAVDRLEASGQVVNEGSGSKGAYFVPPSKPVPGDLVG